MSDFTLTQQARTPDEVDDSTAVGQAPVGELQISVVALIIQIGFGGFLIVGIVTRNPKPYKP